MKKSRKILFLILGFAVLFLVLAWYTNYNIGEACISSTLSCDDPEFCVQTDDCGGERSYGSAINLLIFDSVIWAIFLIWYFYSRKLNW